MNSVYNIIKLSTLFSQVLLLLISWKFPKEEYPTTRRKTFNLLIALSDIEEKLVVKKSLFCCPCPSAFVFFKFSDPVWGQGIYSCSIRPSPDSGKEPILADRASGRLWWGGQKQILQNETKNICLHRVGRHVHCLQDESYWHLHGNCKWTLQSSKLIKLTFCWKYCSWSLIVTLLLIQIFFFSVRT